MLFLNEEHLNEVAALGYNYEGCSTSPKIVVTERRIYEPMRAGEYNEEDLMFPVWGCEKLDGVRGIVQHDTLFSKSLKPIRNLYTQQLFGRAEYHGFDGELIVGAPNDHEVARRTISGVMTKFGTPDVYFYVFDTIAEPCSFMPYDERYEFLKELVDKIYEQDTDSRIRLLKYKVLNCHGDVQTYEVDRVMNGYEGVIIRTRQGLYLPGKVASAINGGILKKKTYKDSEAVILNFIELIRNNKKETNVPGNMLGALIVEDLYTGVQFEIGTGFTKQDRTDIWHNQAHFKGKIVKYSYFPIGMKDKPRHPSFLGFRDEDDLTANGRKLYMKKNGVAQ